jgi:alkylated DNA repair protein alkB family protein 6
VFRQRIAHADTSKPHEDGPAFKPLVATISLGSHQVLDIYHYLSSTSPSPPMMASHDHPTSGQPIAAISLAHLLLLPRSLLIISSSLYSSHLHGIDRRPEDCVLTVDGEAGNEVNGVQIANASLLGDSGIQDAIRSTGKWVGRRGIRTSLTFRHVNKVLRGGMLYPGVAKH